MDITVNLLRKGYLVPVISGQGQVAHGPENSLLAPPNNEAACQKPWLRAWICKHCRIFIQFLGPKLGVLRRGVLLTHVSPVRICIKQEKPKANTNLASLLRFCVCTSWSQSPVGQATVSLDPRHNEDDKPLNSASGLCCRHRTPRAPQAGSDGSVPERWSKRPTEPRYLPF